MDMVHFLFSFLAPSNSSQRVTGGGLSVLPFIFFASEGKST